MVAPTPSSILAAMASASTYFMANNEIGNCDWQRGTLYDGLSSYANVSGDAAALAFVDLWAETFNYTCSDGNPVYDFDANKQCSGHTYARLYERAPADYKLAMAVTLDRQIANKDTSLWTWVDALFMALPTWMRYGALLNDSRLWDTAFASYNYTAFESGRKSDGTSGLWSEPDGLFFRDLTYFNKTTPAGHKIFWARGNGWAISAMAESIGALPAGHPYAVEFTSKLSKMAASLLPKQGADGMWRASLEDASEFPNPETTGTAMFTYAFAWGVNHGILDAATYQPAVLAAWQGLSTIALQPTGFVGYCQPPNGQPAPAYPNSTTDYCVGEFLMAGSEVLRMVSPAQ